MTLRTRIREFLGLPAIQDQMRWMDENLLCVPSLVMFKAMEKKQAETRGD